MENQSRYSSSASSANRIDITHKHNKTPFQKLYLLLNMIPLSFSYSIWNQSSFKQMRLSVSYFIHFIYHKMLFIMSDEQTTNLIFIIIITSSNTSHFSLLCTVVVQTLTHLQINTLFDVSPRHLYDEKEKILKMMMN